MDEGVRKVSCTRERGSGEEREIVIRGKGHCVGRWRQDYVRDRTFRKVR